MLVAEMSALSETLEGMGTESPTMSSRLALVCLGLNMGSGLGFFVMVAVCHCCWGGGGACPEAAMLAKEGFFGALGAFGVVGGARGRGGPGRANPAARVVVRITTCV